MEGGVVDREWLVLLPDEEVPKLKRNSAALDVCFGDARPSLRQAGGGWLFQAGNSYLPSESY